MRYLPAAVLCLACATAHAAGAPAPRELVHPYPPTGPVEVAGTVQAGKALRTMQRYAAPAFTDVLAGHIANTLQGASDPPVTLTRRHKQGGQEAAGIVARAAADGRTLLLANGAPLPALEPVALVASMPYVFVAAPDAKYAALEDLIRDARGAERVLIASAGGTSAAYRALEALRSRRGLRIEPVAYNGGHAALQAVPGKHTSAALVPLPAVLPYVSGGRLKILAIAEPRRHPSLTHVPTGAEAGLADFEAVEWFGVFAPPRTSGVVIRELNTLLARGHEPEPTRYTFESLGLRLEHRAPDAFAELLLRSAHGVRKTGDRGAS